MLIHNSLIQFFIFSPLIGIDSGLLLHGEKAPTFVESLVAKRVSEANETVTKPL